MEELEDRINKIVKEHGLSASTKRRWIAAKKIPIKYQDDEVLKFSKLNYVNWAALGLDSARLKKHRVIKGRKVVKKARIETIRLLSEFVEMRTIEALREMYTHEYIRYNNVFPETDLKKVFAVRKPMMTSEIKLKALTEAKAALNTIQWILKT